MKMRWLAAILTVTLILGVCGCEKQPPETVEPTPVPTQTATPTPEPAVERDALEVYQKTLERLLVEHIDVDGYQLQDDAWDWMGNVEFAIADVDMDGERELLVCCYRRTWVGGYDARSGELLEKLIGTESCRFYDNARVQIDSSHNQGPGGRFWPYTVEEYDPETGEYHNVGNVRAWDSELAPEGYPKDADTEGTGFVYYIWGTGGDGYQTPLPRSAYDAWYEELFGGAEEIEVNYQPLTQENIEKVCVRAAYERFLAGDMSLLEPERLPSWWQASLLKGELEYTYLDLDGDGVEELLLQWIDEPGAYNGVFHYAGGRLYTWQHDEVEMVCWEHPLRDGTMVREYHLGSSSSYTLFRYQADGSREQVASLGFHSQWNDGSGNRFYNVDGREVSQSEFEREVKRLVTDQTLDRGVWTAVPAE